MSNDTYLSCSALADIHDELHDQVGEIEASVESVGERAEVLVCVLEGLAGSGDHRPEVAQHSVGPLELRLVPGLAMAHDLHGVDASGIGHRGKAPQCVAEDKSAREQAGHCIAGEARHLRGLDVERVAFFVERNRRDEGNLVLRAAAVLATGLVAALVRVIDLHSARRAVLSLARSHRLRQLVVHQPGCRAVHTEVAFEFQGIPPCLGLADEMDRVEPHLQRRLGAAKQRACSHRGLVGTGVILEKKSAAADGDSAGGTAALGAREAVSPVSAPQRLRAGVFRAERLQELRKRQAVPELDQKGRHHIASSLTCSHLAQCVVDAVS
jgi:hypothetical protein